MVFLWVKWYLSLTHLILLHLLYIVLISMYNSIWVLPDLSDSIFMYVKGGQQLKMVEVLRPDNNF